MDTGTDYDVRTAESFSDHCVKSVRKDLESFGYNLMGIHCMAEEADMTWLDRLEDAVFSPGEMETR